MMTGTATKASAAIRLSMFTGKYLQVRDEPG
jgi:hypothetical protein